MSIRMQREINELNERVNKLEADFRLLGDMRETNRILCENLPQSGNVELVEPIRVEVKRKSGRAAVSG